MLAKNLATGIALCLDVRGLDVPESKIKELSVC